ncbi:3-oxo-behenoyl-CoA reductase [Aureococcus anophagefferens]|uniref:3-oxo-behenoyl-CoA reductase n=1 Tax=Aureococcus anophagefferens TaxID=44056 RepID=A0ABR1GGB3_AURAN
MPQKRREAFVAAKEAPAALSALEQLVAEAAAAEAGAARTAKREALAAVQAEGRAFRAARSGARRALGRLRADRRGGDDAVGRALRPSTRWASSRRLGRRGRRGAGGDGARRRRPRAAELPPYEAPLLELLRAEHGALVLRWDPRWERAAATRTAATGGPGPTTARSAPRVKLARLGVDEVRAVILRKHGLGAYAEAFAALKVDGAVLQRAMSVGDVEALGVARRADARRLRDVLATLRADGVAEKAICRAYAARAATPNGPGGGSRRGLAPATRYRFRVSVVHGGKQISKFGNVALATTGPAAAAAAAQRLVQDAPDRSRVRDPTGGGWSERTVELLLDGAPPSRDAVFVVLMRDDDDPAGAWVRCHREERRASADAARRGPHLRVQGRVRRAPRRSETTPNATCALRARAACRIDGGDHRGLRRRDGRGARAALRARGPQGLRRAAAAARGLGCFAADFSDEAAVAAFVASVPEPVEVAVHNIGGNVRFPVAETTARVYTKVWECARCPRSTSPRPSCPAWSRGAGHGRLHGRDGVDARRRRLLRVRVGHGREAGARASLAREVGPQGVHVASVIVDGGIDTAFVRDLLGEAAYADLKGRDGLLDPDAIADAYWALHAQRRRVDARARPAALLRDVVVGRGHPFSAGGAARATARRRPPLRPRESASPETRSRGRA